MPREEPTTEVPLQEATEDAPEASPDESASQEKIEDGEPVDAVHERASKPDAEETGALEIS